MEGYILMLFMVNSCWICMVEYVVYNYSSKIFGFYDIVVGVSVMICKNILFYNLLSLYCWVSVKCLV